jgi:hypothetical protein
LIAHLARRIARRARRNCAERPFSNKQHDALRFDRIVILRADKAG